jgi:hypothetical protein
MPAQPGLPERGRTLPGGHRVPDIGALDPLAHATQHLGPLEQPAERCCGIARTSFLYGGKWLTLCLPPGVSATASHAWFGRASVDRLPRKGPRALPVMTQRAG